MEELAKEIKDVDRGVDGDDPCGGKPPVDVVASEGLIKEVEEAIRSIRGSVVVRKPGKVDGCLNIAVVDERDLGRVEGKGVAIFLLYDKGVERKTLERALKMGTIFPIPKGREEWWRRGVTAVLRPIYNIALWCIDMAGIRAVAARPGRVGTVSGTGEGVWDEVAGRVLEEASYPLTGPFERALLEILMGRDASMGNGIRILERVAGMGPLEEAFLELSMSIEPSVQPGRFRLTLMAAKEPREGEVEPLTRVG